MANGERIQEDFTLRNLGVSGLARRAQARINLPTLRDSLLRSDAIRQNQIQERQRARTEQEIEVRRIQEEKERNRLAELRKRLQGLIQENTNQLDTSLPLVVGRTLPTFSSAGGLTLATPSGRGGFQLRTILNRAASLGGPSSVREGVKQVEALQKLGVKIPKDSDLPILNTLFQGKGRSVSSIDELRSLIALKTRG